MGFVHYTNKGPSRDKLLRGETPTWIKNSKRGSYIARVVLSCPTWVDRSVLFSLNRLASIYSEHVGVPLQLDHEIPLNHPRVCGLTVPWNIEIKPAKVNMAKSNYWCPEQMEMF